MFKSFFLFSEKLFQNVVINYSFSVKVTTSELMCFTGRSIDGSHAKAFSEDAALP